MNHGRNAPGRVLLEAAIDIPRPADAVWAFVRDMENYPLWFVGIVRMRSADALPVGAPGKRYDEAAVTPGGGIEQIAVTVLEADDDARRLAIAADLKPFLPRFDYEVLPLGDDASRYIWRCTMRSRSVGAHLAAPVFQRIVGGRLGPSLGNLKRILAGAPAERMHAAVFREFGDADAVMRCVDHAPRPQPGPKEVLVRQAASSVNHIDCHRRRGYGHRVFRMRGALERPVIVGNDVCGTVAAVGAQVRTFRPGDAVLGVKPPSSHGAFADYVCTEAALLAQRPASMTPAAAAGLPYAFFTAWSALARDGGLSKANAARRSVFVQGAGGVGAMAVQIAAFLGADVTVSCHADQIDTMKRAGARDALDFRTLDHAPLEGRFDIVLCTADPAEEDRLVALLHARGGARYVTIIHPTLALTDEKGVLRGMIEARARLRALNGRLRRDRRRAYWSVFRADPAATTMLARMLDAGRIHADVGATFPLRDVAAAMQRLESGAARGKVIIAISDNTGAPRAQEGDGP